MAEGRSSARANLFVPRSGGGGGGALGSFLARHSLSSFEPADGRTDGGRGREGGTPRRKKAPKEPLRAAAAAASLPFSALSALVALFKAAPL